MDAVQKAVVEQAKQVKLDGNTNILAGRIRAVIAEWRVRPMMQSAAAALEMELSNAILDLVIPDESNVVRLKLTLGDTLQVNDEDMRAWIQVLQWTNMLTPPASENGYEVAFQAMVELLKDGRQNEARMFWKAAAQELTDRGGRHEGIA